jgi:thiamine-phosphate pyrophosphorylase
VSASLPRLLVVTDRHLCEQAGRSLPEVVDGLADLPLGVLFREKDLDDAERLRLGRAVASSTAVLLVSGDHLLAAQLGAVGVHLAADQPTPSVPPGMLVGRSCHSIDDVLAAHPCDYVTLSPVADSLSKPGYRGSVSRDELAKAVAATDVFALGGVTPENAAELAATGVAGLAACGSVMGAGDPARVAEQLLEALP